MVARPNAIDSAIALFLCDAGSEHQAFSKQVLRDYLIAEGHDEQDILEALDDWSRSWLGNAQRDDEFYLDRTAWAKVECLRRRQFSGQVSDRRRLDARTIFHTVTHWAVARLSQENLS